MHTAAGETRDYATMLADAEREASDLLNAQRSLYSSTTTVAQAMADAGKAIAENGRTLSLNSEKGRENRRALDSVAGAMKAQYDATVAVNGVGVTSARVAQTNADKFVALAGKAGLSAGKARELARELGLIPSKRETKIIAETKAAEAAAKRVRDMLAQIKNRTVSVNVIFNEQRRSKVANQLGSGAGNFAGATGFQGAATGGGGRTQAPTPVNVESLVTVQLDGRPFATATAVAVRSERRSAQWRSKYGGRS
jgi:hypothetical protein